MGHTSAPGDPGAVLRSSIALGRSGSQGKFLPAYDAILCESAFEAWGGKKISAAAVFRCQRTVAWLLARAPYGFDIGP